MIRDNLVMIRGFFNEFKHTGTIFNSSKWAARALTNPVRDNNGPKNILEVGAGTGPVTEKIIKDMESSDNLMIVEINPAFMVELKRKITKMPEYQQHADRIVFFEGPIQSVPEDKSYDVIVCALPFLNFELPLVHEIFCKLQRLSNNDTLMTYYQYIGLSDLGRVISPKERKKRLNQIDSYLKRIGEKNLIGREKVWLNFLPINIYTLQFPLELSDPVDGITEERRAI